MSSNLIHPQRRDARGVMRPTRSTWRSSWSRGYATSTTSSLEDGRTASPEGSAEAPHYPLVRAREIVSGPGPESPEGVVEAIEAEVGTEPAFAE